MNESVPTFQQPFRYNMLNGPCQFTELRLLYRNLRWTCDLMHLTGTRWALRTRPPYALRG